MTPFEKYSLWINIIFAFLTFAAIIAAIWGEKIRQIWTKPKLKINLCEPSLTKTNTGIRGWYYIIQVSNERSSSPANNARILLTNIYKKDTISFALCTIYILTCCRCAARTCNGRVEWIPTICFRCALTRSPPTKRWSIITHNIRSKSAPALYVICSTRMLSCKINPTWQVHTNNVQW